MKRTKLPILIAWLIVCCGCAGEKAPEGMVLVPSGYFQMGANETDEENHALSLGLAKPWYADESPERRLRLADFFIDRYEVTNKEYYIFCQATDHKPPKSWRGQKYEEGEDNLPVSHVSFFDAEAYAQWAGKRLPTEMEWEKAARGPNGNIYPWGNSFQVKLANVSPSGRLKRGRGLKPVGSFPKGVSPYGVHDMVGNVWEWVWDYYLPYPGNEYSSPEYSKKRVIVRGLSFMGVGHFNKTEYRKVVALQARASYREKLSPLSRKNDVGFRCAKDRRSWFELAFGSSSGEEKTAPQMS